MKPALSKTDAPGYLKDEKTGFLLNQNLQEYELLKSRRRRGSLLSSMERRISALEEKIARMEDALK